MAGPPQETAWPPARQEGDIDLVAILGALGHSGQQPSGVRTDPAGNDPAELFHGHQHPGRVSHPDHLDHPDRPDRPDRPRRHGRAGSALLRNAPS